MSAKRPASADLADLLVGRETLTAVLPGGYVDPEGRVHADAALVPMDGRAEDLLAAAPEDACAASLTTLVLSRALRRIGAIHEITPALVRDLLVQDRDYLLVELRGATLGWEMWIRLACPHAACGKELELPLMLDALPFEARPVRQRTFTLDLPPVVEFRLPTGGDQEAVAMLDTSEASRRLLERCLGETDPDALGSDALDAIERRIQELAPDVTPELDTVCQECQQPFSTLLDLPYLILREMRSSAARLEQDVHLLAWHYHWSEREILAMPRSKRQRYLKRVLEEIDMPTLHSLEA